MTRPFCLSITAPSVMAGLISAIHVFLSCTHRISTGKRADTLVHVLRLRLYDRKLGADFMRNLGIVALCAALGGCVSTGETVAFRPSNPQQQAMMRDGRPALVSRQKNSLVLVRPAARQLQANGRPVFVVGINNIGKQPTDFRVGQVEAVQHVGGSDFAMQIVTFEMLQQEEKNRQVARAVLAGVAGAANAYSASQAGHGTYTTPSGRTGTFYSPTAAVIAQNNGRHSERGDVRRGRRNGTTQHGHA
ncbi:hypothetical protein J6524_28920 [Bradyrhizobium sp. WSM 1738]|uniref:hypothetical protein n=1 Tax=Bradyrhizobium hereditatis TaxID=2821405 RepID=UPI001CE2F314|nr:hypothetical protein [Bradyrhizobium hereditatis]MCA6118872.1 hypothetical protein [Bradyrhizobium hereditatis]